MSKSFTETGKTVLSQAQFEARRQAGTLTEGEYAIKGTPQMAGDTVDTDTIESATLVGGSKVGFAHLSNDNQWHLTGSTIADSALKVEDNLYLSGIENIKKSGTQVSLFWHGTQAQYDALGTYNADTLYIITG